MRYITMIVITLFYSSMLIAQRGNAEQKAAIDKLRWMTGSWAGTSTVKTDSIMQVTNIRETIVSALDGTILQITVRATDKDTNTNRQSLAYTAFSVISYDLKDKKYVWTSWRNTENDYDQHSFTVGDNSFEYISKENGGQVRYKASSGSNGEFLETGEYSKNGSDWGQFITMKLLKVQR